MVRGQCKGLSVSALVLVFAKNFGSAFVRSRDRCAISVNRGVSKEIFFFFNISSIACVERVHLKLAERELREKVKRNALFKCTL